MKLEFFILKDHELFAEICHPIRDYDPIKEGPQKAQVGWIHVREVSNNHYEEDKIKDENL